VLYEFALMPDLFDSSLASQGPAHRVVLLELLRGISENGLIADFHHARLFRHIIGQRIPALSPALQGKVLSYLKVLDDRHRLVRHPKCLTGEPSSDADWLQLAFDSHDRVPFRAIVLGQTLMNGSQRKCDALVEFFGSLDSELWSESRKRSLSLEKSPTAYRSALASILRHAKSLALVDPHLNVQARFFGTVAICSNVMGQRGHARLHGRIDIHAEAKCQSPDGLSIADHLAAWGQKLAPLVSADGHRFRVFLWESLQDEETLHDRFILTDQCAISTPGGLDCRSSSHPNSTDWSLLDEDARLLRWDNYDPSSSPFKLMEKREFP